MPAALLQIPLDGKLSRYLREIQRFPIFSAEEELAFVRGWRDRQDVEASYKLVASHLRLVAKIAMCCRGYGLPVGELVGEGNVGMMKAVKRFDPDRGLRLATYAMWWIRAAIRSEGDTERQDWLVDETVSQETAHHCAPLPIGDDAANQRGDGHDQRHT